ncbi:nitrite reductase [Frankia sp. CiP3]|uniref:nitrite reductase n=1 Tax=Frankia sp. CiP3 TaxID=2880971 RepID=UPI001EF4DB38|nr:nitrite reductase [Frankia sp. CiP3]
MTGDPTPARVLPDRCPGALRAHQAADGLLARVRLPGGFLSAEQLLTLVAVAAAGGDPRLELTTRANVQVRALAEHEVALSAARLADAGLLPSVTHERVRNIMASPLAGLDSPTDLAAVVAELDTELCARPGLADLPGRFLFGVDDGRGDIASLHPDITLVLTARTASVCGFSVPRAAVVPTALAFAESFLAERAVQNSAAWRVAELTGGISVVARRALAPGGFEVPAGRDVLPPRLRPAGLVEQVDGGTALVALAPLGRLSSAQATLLARHAGPRGLRVTPWRGIVLPDLPDPEEFAAAAADLGLGVDDTSPWYWLSACTGTPGCTSALADVQTDAAAAAGRWPGRHAHFSGCRRRCGRPADTRIDVIATDEGYVFSDD